MLALSKTLSIPNGQTESAEMDFTGSNRLAATSLHIYSPGTLTGTVTVEVSADDGANWVTLQSAGSDVEIPAGKCTVIDIEPSWDAMRFSSDGAEGAQRDFIVRLVENFPHG